MRNLKLYRETNIDNDVVVESQSDDYHFICARKDKDGLRIGRESVITAVFDIPESSANTLVGICHNGNHKVIGISIDGGELIKYTDFVVSNYSKCYTFETSGEHIVKYFFNLANTDLGQFFWYASDVIKEIDLSHYYSKNLTNLYAFAFSKNNILKKIKGLEFLNTKYVTNMGWFTRLTYNIESIGDLSRWNTDSLTNLSGVFNGCRKITSIGDIKNWNTSNVTNFNSLFSGCRMLSLGDLSKWDMSKSTDIGYMFSECSFTSGKSDIGDIGHTWDINAKCTNLSGLFNYCKKNFTLNTDISNWDTSNVTNMAETFRGIEGEKYVGDIGKWNTSKVTNMYNMFEGTVRLNVGKEDIDLSKWDVSKVKNFSRMFLYSDVVPNIFEQVKDWDVSSATNLSWMFYNIHLSANHHFIEPSADLSNWDVSNVTNMDTIFYYTSVEGRFDLSNWDLKSITSTSVNLFTNNSFGYLAITDSFFNSAVATEYVFRLLLPRENVMDIFYNNLKDITDKTKFQGKKIVLPYDERARLTDDDITKIESIGFELEFRNFTNN